MSESRVILIGMVLGAALMAFIILFGVRVRSCTYDVMTQEAFK
jgi:hypothetical protein